MEKHPNPFDEFLKETLKGHQLAPPEEAKKAFIEEATAIIKVRKAWQNWYYIPILVLFLLGLVTSLYIGKSNEPAIPEISIDQQNSKDLKSNPLNTSTLNSKPSENSSATQSSVHESVTEKINIPVKIKTEANSNTLSSAAAVIPDNNQRLPANGATENVTTTSASRLPLDSLKGSGVINSDSSVHIPLNKADTTSALPSSVNVAPGDLTVEKQENYFTAGIYYMPEWVFNTFDGTNFFYNLGIEGTYYIGAFSISSGAGISMSNDVSKIAVEYNDYLGSYNKLDSISFTFNDQAHNFIPKYYMSSEKVWDTVPLLDYQDIKMRYTYLRIPLVLGYDFWKKGRFSLGVRLGTAISLLLNSRQLSGNYNPGDKKVINIYKITPDYISVNCQMTGGLNASVKMADKLYFEIEPIATYLYNSVYESPGSSKVPVAVGFRTAVVFKF